MKSIKYQVILDTDILSEYFKGYDPNVAAHARAYAAHFARFTFTSVTVYEVTLGLTLKGATSQLQRALAWMRQNEQIVPVEDDYLIAARIKAAAASLAACECQSSCCQLAADDSWISQYSTTYDCTVSPIPTPPTPTPQRNRPRL